MNNWKLSNKVLGNVVFVAAASAISVSALAGAYDGNDDPIDPPKVVVIDKENKDAYGSLVSTRFSNDSTSRIGCGTNVYIVGENDARRSGFCQAVNSDNESIRCRTENETFIEQIGTLTAASYVRFTWTTKFVEAVNDEGNLQQFEVHTCNSMYINTDSRYIPASDAGQ